LTRIMSNLTASFAKTTRPTLSMVVMRERLFRKLDEAAENKAIWIFGPPGSGKTTLMASYVASRNRLSLWYQLDGNDADVASFFYYLRRTALLQCGESGAVIPELPASVENWDNYSRQLFRSIFACFNQPLIMVFDNYETVPPHSNIHEVFKRVIEEVPAGSLLVFISRTSPTPNLARPLANNFITLIDGDDLKLSRDECTQIANVRKVEVSSLVLDRILESTSGWITGSIIMLESAKKSGQPDKRQFGTAGNILFDYVANEIYASLDEVTREILLRVCWSRRINKELAESVGGEDVCVRTLSTLAKNNYFVTERIDSPVREFIIHPLLRDFLQQKARVIFAEQTFNSILRETAEQLIRDGQTDEAVELLAGNLDWDTLVPIIIKHAPLLLDQGRSALLTAWLEELPRDRLNNDPWLLFWYGMACRKQAPREARHHFELAFHKFKTDVEYNREGMQFCCCGFIEVVIAEMDDFSLLDNWISELLQLLEGGFAVTDSPFVKSPEILMLLTLIIRRPDFEHLEDWFRRAEKSERSQSRPQARCNDLFWLILVYLLAGELVKAGQKIGDLQRLMQEQTDVFASCECLLLTALHHVLCGSGNDADAAARAALQLAEENKYSMLLPFIHACGCCAALVRNDDVDAEAWLARFTPMDSMSNRLTRFLYHYILSWRCLISDEIINAHHEQRRALNFAVELGMPYFEVLSRTALGQLLFSCDDARGVNAQLRRVHTIAREIKNPLLEFMTLLVYGDVALRQGRTSTGTNALRYALRLGREHAYYHLPWWQTTQLAKVCASALQQGIEVDYVREFIIRRSLQPVPLSIEINEWPWPYRINTFGEQRIKKYDRVKLVGQKNDSRPMRLLMILIAKGARDVPLNEVAEVLWPHVDSEYGVKSLTINLHRLRRLFSNDDSITLREGRLSLNNRLIWVDTWAMERHLINIESTLTLPGYQPTRDGIRDLFDKLLALYQGAFLGEDEEYACFIAARSHYRMEFIRGINLLIDMIITQNIPLSVPELYNQCLQKDPLAEGIYRRLLLWYLDANRHVDAMDTYDRCRSIMARTAQLTPSAEMQSIYKQLVKMPVQSSRQPR